MFVAAEEFRGASEVLGDASVGAGTGQGIEEQLVSGPGEVVGFPQCLAVEGFWHGVGASGEEFAGSAVRIGRAREGWFRVLIAVVGPEGAQDEDRSAVGVGKEAVEGGGDPLAVLGVAEVVLGLVEPHHRAGLDAFEVGNSGFGSARIVGVP
jgi:hypothetical protein